MKKILYIIASIVALTAFASCEKDQYGSMPGNDSTPAVRVFTSTVSGDYNPDNDIAVKFAANNATTDLYYKAFKKADFDAMTTENAIEAIISGGTKATTKVNEFDGSQILDITLTGLYGEYVIAAAAVSGSQKTLGTASFTGLDWNDIKHGTYYFAEAFVSKFTKKESAGAKLQQCKFDKNLYRIVFDDLDYSFKFSLLPDYTSKDTYGDYTFMRVTAQKTSFTYGSYGTISLRDIGYWQGKDSFVLTSGYEGGMYTNGDCFFYLQYFCSGGSLGYAYDEFYGD